MVLVNFWRYPDPYQRFLIRIRPNDTDPDPDPDPDPKHCRKVSTMQTIQVLIVETEHQ